MQVMQVNSVNNNSQPSFKAYITNDFYVAARNHFNKIRRPERFDMFEKQMAKIEQMGTTNMRVSHKRIFEDGKPQYALLVNNGDKQAVLTVKDQFRKIVEKFMHINEYEFNIKTKDIM